MTLKEKFDPETLNIIANYRPIDDEFMRSLFRNNMKLAQEVIRIVTGKKDLRIVEEHTQYDMNRLLGSRSVCLDVFCRDDSGGEFDIEIHREDGTMPPERPRYHLSVMDVDFLKAGAKFNTLPTTYSIIFAEEDFLKKGQLIYFFDRLDINTGVPLNDRTHIIIVNCAYNNPDDKSDAAELARDFVRSDPDKMSTKILADTVRYYKTVEEGVSDMCRTIEELKAKVTEDVTRKVTEDVTKKVTEDVTKKVTEDVTKKNSMEMALKLISLGMEKGKIEIVTGLNADEVNKLAASLN